MQRNIKSFIRKNLQKFSGEIIFASLFGSYKRGDYDAFSDIDVFIVCMDEEDKPLISRELKSLEPILGKNLHVNLFSLKEFERRLRFHDYLTASIIEDSSFILGRKDAFADARWKILEGCPDEKAIRFNMDAGFKTLKHVYWHFSELSSSGSRDYEDLLNHAVRGLNDYRLGLGYIYASAQMRSVGRGVSFKWLTQTRFSSALSDVAQVEKIIKRRSIDYMALSKLVNEIKDESLRILTLNQNSFKRRVMTPIPSYLEKSFIINPLKTQFRCCNS